MKSTRLMTIVFFSLAAVAAVPQSTKKPLTKEQVTELITGSVASARVAELVREDGIDFTPTEEYLSSLREAGAEPVVVEALRAADASRKQAQADVARQKAQDDAAKVKQAIKAGNILMDIGDLEGAIKLYQEAIQANPNDGEAHRMLGMALGEKKDWQGDINEQRTAILLDPNDAAAKTELKAALQAAAKASTADLVVKALPGADVYLDDELRGKTSPLGELKIENLKPGNHSLRVSLPGKEPFEQEISLAAGQSSEVGATLGNLAGRIVVRTLAAAEVFLDSVSRGVADSSGGLTIPNAAPGSHELRITAANKKEFRQSVTVAPGEATRIDAELEDLPPAPGMIRDNPKDGLKYAWIPPGTFMMGCSPGEPKCDGSESPRHEVRITRGFWMSQLEVNTGAYKRFSSDTQKPMPTPPIFNRDWSNDRLPIVKVSWNTARDFCTWAGGRLPTEAEWEYAARGGTTDSLYGPLEDIAWFARNSGSGGNQWGNPNAGGLKQPNAYQLYDMLGNVFEWTNDWFDAGYYARSPHNDPAGPETGKERVVRGRAWVAYADDMRVSYRGSNPPDSSFFEGGFRCAMDTLKQ
jgi:formylglycine-generating enzyme required for sulfatase activity/Flp pilus assembly protein TadD